MILWIQNLFARRPGWVLGGLVAAFLLTALGGAVAMFLLLNLDRVNARLAKIMNTPAAQEQSDQRDYAWSTQTSALLSFDMARVELGDMNQGVMGGGVEGYGDGLIYVSSIGVIGYLDVEAGELMYFDERVPMDYERVRNQVLFDKSQFQLRYFRVHDIMVKADPQGRDWLYVSHHMMPPGDDTICQAIHKIGLQQTENGIALDSAGWQHVYTVKPCFNMLDIGWRFIGDVSGGRMVPLGPSTFLYSVGSYMFAYNAGGVEQIRSDDTDLGKILEIDSQSNTASIYAKGFRNPQGLVRAADGTIWETEHGPMGGDEINLIERGEDYGWPMVTYGLNYGPSDWPFSDDQGRHEGYKKPVHAFPVSIAPSQLVEVAPGSEFERWSGDLLLGSLKAQSLFRLRMDQGRLVTMEQVEVAERMRDMTWLENGWLAVLTGNSSILLLRAASQNEQPHQAVRLTGYVAVKSLESELAANLRSGSYGRQLFAIHCATCHNLGSEPAPGPSLGGVVGTRIGRNAEYNYSAALQSADGRWTRAKLKAYLADPDGMYPGTSMPQTGMPLDDYSVRALVDYLATTDAPEDAAN